MRTTVDKTCLLVKLEDAYGVPTGKEVEVHIDFIRDAEVLFGADAGTGIKTLVEYTPLDFYIEPDQLLTLNSQEVEEALAIAKRKFDSMELHHG